MNPTLKRRLVCILSSTLVGEALVHCEDLPPLGDGLHVGGQLGVAPRHGRGRELHPRQLVRDVVGQERLQGGE